ncbi:hypothetical protein ANO14919_070170 [Xylariales sp. No.14919]|nr:hypothetical protein ANO14919_070170 [Xylariales sp. No.14919]
MDSPTTTTTSNMSGTTNTPEKAGHPGTKRTKASACPPQVRIDLACPIEVIQESCRIPTPTKYKFLAGYFHTLAGGAIPLYTQLETPMAQENLLRDKMGSPMVPLRIQVPNTEGVWFVKTRPGQTLDRWDDQLMIHGRGCRISVLRRDVNTILLHTYPDLVFDRMFLTSLYSNQWTEDRNEAALPWTAYDAAAARYMARIYGVPEAAAGSPANSAVPSSFGGGSNAGAAGGGGGGGGGGRDLVISTRVEEIPPDVENGEENGEWELV